jgi:hypothetical protein
MATPQAVQQIRQAEYDRYEAYRAWEEKQRSDPRFASVRFLYEDMRDHGEIQPATWERFDVEERTWGAEVLNAPHSHIDRFRFDGNDIIVKETDGVQPRVTLREVYQKGLDKTRADVVDEPGLAYQLRRDELFMEFYEDIERMMRGEADYDTIHMISTCPIPEELSDDPDEAARLMKLRWYDNDRRKSFDYTARRLPNGELELSATTLDSSNMQAHAEVLQASGYENVSFALLSSHEYGAYRSHANTTEQPIETVIAARAAVYDASLEAQTGQPHRFGRLDDTVDAHKFFDEHCADYWAGYKAYHELFARHLAGGELHEDLRNYLMTCMARQEQVGQSVLTKDKIDRLRIQLSGGRITPEMAMSCRELLVYDHHATLSRLLKQYNETGMVDQLDTNGGDFMGAYAEAASSNGSAAAANGETFAGCETAVGVNSLSNAATSAAEQGVSLEQILRAQEEEAAHCLRIQLYGYTIRKGVHCPFCDQKVDARDSTATIECLNADCRTVLDKATGETSSLREQNEKVTAKEETQAEVIKLRTGQLYRLGEHQYRREQRTVVGGATIMYIDPAGQRIEGHHAEQLDAIISQQLLAESRAA